MPDPEAVIAKLESYRQRQDTWQGKKLQLMPWQKELVHKIFGSDPRQVRQAFAFVPRKNGKTCFAAALAVYMLTEDVPGAEVYLAATSRDQAGLAFDDAAFMVQHHNVLRNHCKVSEFRKTIKYTAMHSVLKAISADVAGAYGLRPSFAVCDELHLWGKNARLYEALRTGMVGRQHPLLVSITTAGVYGESDLCLREYDHAKKVLAGEIDDPAYAAVILEAGEKADWHDEDVWRACNPGIEHGTVNLDFLRSEARTAEQQPSYENTFRREYLNQWTSQRTRWLNMDAWRQCGGELPDLYGVPCYAGLDLSSNTDTTALVLAFGLDEHVYLLPFFYIPEDNAAEREKRDRVPYLAWAKAGLVTLTPGNVVDYSYIRRDLVRLADEYAIQAVAYDPWEATQIATQLAEDDGIPTIKFRQGFQSMSSPTKRFETHVVGGTLRHGDNPVLERHAGTVSVQMNAAGGMKPDRRALKSWQRIDGVVAAIMAVGLLEEHIDKQPSKYEKEGALYLEV